MPATVKKLCGSLVKGQWLSADGADKLQQQWAAQPGTDSDLDGFLKFAVRQGRLTDAQRQKVLASLHKMTGEPEPAPKADGTGPKKPLAPPTPATPDAEFDVELVEVPRARIKVPGQGINLDRRDWLMLSLGGAGALVAVGSAAALAKILQPKPLDLELPADLPPVGKS